MSARTSNELEVKSAVAALWIQPLGLSHLHDIMEATPADAPTSHRGLTANHSAKNREGAMSQTTQTHRHLAPDDPRHGTTAGYRAHSSTDRQPCDPCREAGTAYSARRVHDARNGRVRRTDPTGYRRRVEALQAIGWSLKAIGGEVGDLPNRISERIRYPKWVHRDVDQLMSDAYERMCMSPPAGSYASRVRTIAARKGYAPPLAWDDIDTDPQPHIMVDPDADFIDEVKVQRVLDGRRQDCTRAERSAVIKRWGGSQLELQQITGWNVARILRDERKAA